MGYSPYARKVTLSFNEDYTATDSVLETIASLLDMEIKEFTQPISQESGAIILTKYIALPNTTNGFAVFVSSSNSNNVCFVGIYDEKTCTGSYQYIRNGTVSLYNISAKTKAICNAAGANNGLILTNATDSNDNECYVHYFFSTSKACLKKNGIGMNSSDITTYGLSTQSANEKGSNYVEMLPITYPVYDCNIDTIYIAVNVYGETVISLNDNIYSIICSTANSNFIAIKN